MNLAISRRLLDRLMREAEAAGGREICGLLVGEPGLISALVPLRNAHLEPETAFVLDPAEHVAAARLARAAGQTVLGHYHSHPSGDNAPSPSDAAGAHEEGIYWLIIGTREARLWISRGGGAFLRAFEPVELEII
jgi:proteasome lid subunit RPN8/RPN11